MSRFSACVVLTMLMYGYHGFTAAALADESSKAKARAALALAKAKREREAAQIAAGKPGCHTDYDKAAKEAAAKGKPLVLWVGCCCDDYPDLRKALDNAVHVHMPERKGTPEPAVVIQGGDGNEYYVKPMNIKADTGAKIKSKWNLPYVPPLRFDVRVSEEFTRLPPTMPATIARVADRRNTSWPVSMRTGRTRTFAPRVEIAGDISAGCVSG